MGFWQVVAGVAAISVLGAGVAALLTRPQFAAGFRSSLRRPRTLFLGVPALLAMLVVGVPFVYLQSTRVESVAPLSFDSLDTGPDGSGDSAGGTAGTSASDGATDDTGDPGQDPDSVGERAADDAGAQGTSTSAPNTTGTTGTTLAPPGPVDGPWVVGPGSEGRYAVDDTILGQTQRVVGRTDQVSGEMEIVDSVVTSARVVVNMQSVRCNCVHDSKYREMLAVDRYPTSTFELASPIPLSEIPADGQVVQIPVTGEFTIHGETRGVTFTLDAVRRGGRIAVLATIPVRLEDYRIQNPDAGPLGGLSNPAIEFLVAFDPA